MTRVEIVDWKLFDDEEEYKKPTIEEIEKND